MEACSGDSVLIDGLFFVNYCSDISSDLLCMFTILVFGVLCTWCDFVVFV